MIFEYFLELTCSHNSGYFFRIFLDKKPIEIKMAEKGEIRDVAQR